MLEKHRGQLLLAFVVVAAFALLVRRQQPGIKAPSAAIPSAISKELANFTASFTRITGGLLPNLSKTAATASKGGAGQDQGAVIVTSRSDTSLTNTSAADQEKAYLDRGGFDDLGGMFGALGAMGIADDAAIGAFGELADVAA